jgi:flagellar FliL protein
MAAPKNETQPATPPAASAPAAAAVPPAANAAAPAATAAPSASPLKAWLPVLAAVVLSPALTFATVEFVLLPRLTRQLTTAASAEPAPAKEKAKSEKGGEKGGKEGGKEDKEGYEFSSVVVNLAGTMGTRYLKTTFLVTGADPTIKEIFEGNKPRLTDVTLNVLSSLTLADLEEPGAKNVIREKLVTAYNQTLGRKVADQVYFSDFVVQ